MLSGLGLVAEWIHFTLFGIILPTIKLKVYTFWGLLNITLFGIILPTTKLKVYTFWGL